MKLRDATIRQKLMATTMVPIAVIMVAAIIVFVLWEQANSRRYLVEDTLSRIEMLADNCKAALVFDSKEDAVQVLSSLRFRDSVAFACVYDKEGGVFAQYESEDVTEKIQPSKPQEDKHAFQNGYFFAFKQIILDDEIIGAVYIRDDMRSVYSGLRLNIVVAVVVLLVALAAGYLLSSNLQAMISRPIVDLTKAAKEVSEKKDYSIRALVKSNDEVGYLTQAFNRMLRQIQQRDSALVRAKGQLEERVRERTGDLTATNKRLTEEITERVKAEDELKRIADEWKTTFDSITDMVSIHDKDFKILRANKSFASVFEMEVSEIVGETCYELIHGTKEPPPFCPHNCTLDTGKPGHIEFFDPNLGIHVEASTSPIFDESGQAVASVHIAKDITERKRAEAELKAAQEKLIETARAAGMAEVAADVLHNVGNVLNSVNVSATLIREKVTNSELANLEKVAGIVNEHIDDLGTFLTEDPRGERIPVYLTEVSRVLTDERTDIISKLKVLTDNVRHIKDIISTQQSYARVSGVEVQTSVEKLAEDAIQINTAGLERHGTRLIREFEELGEVEIDKQRVLQILVNLINNAKYALSSSKREEKLLTIRIYKHGEARFRIEVADNGVGIDKDNLTKIFSHGFTTKEGGHGFGLHSSALAAKEMAGSLTAHSDGVGQGATFTLELPFKPKGSRNERRMPEEPAYPGD